MQGTKTARKVVSAIATSRALHHDRPCSTSRALFSVFTIATSAAEPLQMAHRGAHGENAPAVGAAESLHRVPYETQDLTPGEGCEHASQIVGQVLQRKEDRHREQSQHGREEREEEVVRQLGEETQAIVVEVPHVTTFA